MALYRKIMDFVRSMYDWVLHWADTKYGTPALITLSFAESSFFPIPPDPLLMALALGKRTKAIHFAVYCTLASVIGGILGYYIGFALFETVGQQIIDFYNGQAVFDSLQTKFNDHSVIAIIIAAITPIPYKIFTITAGVCKTDIVTFLLASLIGRGFRFGAEGVLIKLFGDPIKNWIDKYFDKLAILFAVLLILGFAVIKYAF